MLVQINHELKCDAFINYTFLPKRYLIFQFGKFFFPSACHDWYIVFQMHICCLHINPGHFEKGVAEGAVDPSFNPVLAFRLSVLKDSAVWAILSEVSQS